MDEPASQRWFLHKHEGGIVFGPLSFEKLTAWASSAQIAAHDLISSDQQTWMKAPMLAQLGMDWLVEVTSERYYGPTTLGAIQEFIRLGEIDEETFLINSCDGSRRQIREMPSLVPISRQEMVAAAVNEAPEPAASGISVDLQERIRDLEQSLIEERRAYQELEQHYRELESRLGSGDR
jgi:hypothetical protein